MENKKANEEEKKEPVAKAAAVSDTKESKFQSAVKTTKKFTIRAIIIILIATIGGFWIYSTMNFSEGNRAGRVVKLSKKGVMFKTWEGQMNFEDNQEFWAFSVEGSQEQVRANIDQAMEENKRVKLHYKEKYITFPWRGDTKYLIYKVEILQ